MKTKRKSGHTWKFLSLLLVGTVFFACSNEEEMNGLPSRLQLQVEMAPSSRAIIHGSSLPSTAKVGVFLTAENGASYGTGDTYNIAYTATGEGAEQTWGAESDILLTATKGTLYAYYPYSQNITDLTAIPVGAETQTDWMYATPVTGVSKDQPKAAAVMNHALAAVDIVLVRNSYLGTGVVTDVTVSSPAFATAAVLDATTGQLSSFTGTGEDISVQANITLSDEPQSVPVLVVPTGTEAEVNISIIADGKPYQAVTDAKTILAGQILQWEAVIQAEAPNGVYAVTAEGQLIDYNSADETAIGVALVAGEHKFMIEKNETKNTETYKAAYNEFGATNTDYTYLYWGGYGTDQTGIPTYNKADASNSYGYLPQADGSYYSTPNLTGDYTTWISGALSDFNGKANSDVIKTITTNGTSSSKKYAPMGILLNKFNDANNEENGGYTDWYIPAAGQLALIYLNKTEINAVLTKIGGTALTNECYWSSSENSSYYGWYVHFDGGDVTINGKSYYNRVRFVRDLQ